MQAQPDLDLLKGSSHTVTPCLAMEQERSTSGLAANELEPQEVEGRGSAQPLSLAPYGCMAAELQQSGLLLVEREARFLEPRSRRIPEAPRIGLVLEAGHDVIGVAHEYHVAGGFSPPPLQGPEIEDVVQVDVGEQR